MLILKRMDETEEVRCLSARKVYEKLRDESGKAAEFTRRFDRFISTRNLHHCMTPDKYVYVAGIVADSFK